MAAVPGAINLSILVWTMLGALHEIHWPNALGQFSVSENHFSLVRSTSERSQQGATPPKYVDKTENSEVWNTSTTVRGPKSRLFWTCLGDHHVLSSFWRDLGGQMSWVSLQKPSIWNNSNRAGYHFPEWLPSPVIRVGVLRPWPLHSLGFDAWGQPYQGSVGPVSHRMQWGLLLRWISTSETGQKRQNRGLAGDFGVLRLTGRWARRSLEAFWSLQGDQVNSKFPLRVWARLDPASRNPHTTRMGQIWTISDFEVAIFRSQGPDQPLLFPKDRQNQVSQRTISATKPRFRASQRGLKDRIPRLGVFWRLSKPFRSWGVTVRTVFAGLGGIFQKSTANLDIRQGIPTVGEGNYAIWPLPDDRFRPISTARGQFRVIFGLRRAQKSPHQVRWPQKSRCPPTQSGSLRLLGKFGSPPGSRSSKYDADRPASHEESAQIFGQISASRRVRGVCL